MSLWRKRNVHHNEQNQPKWFNMTALANNDLSIKLEDLSIKQSKGIDEDDDIQDYKKPWVGLTDEEIYEAVKDKEGSSWRVIIDAIEAKLKEKNT